MNYRQFYSVLISDLLQRKILRDAAAALVSADIPIDVEYAPGEQELLTNCEWAIRHAAEPNYYTSNAEFAYCLRCLQGDEQFSAATRDQIINESDNQPKGPEELKGSASN